VADFIETIDASAARRIEPSVAIRSRAEQSTFQGIAINETKVCAIDAALFRTATGCDGTLA